MLASSSSSQLESHLREIAPLQEIHGDVMQQGGEPYILTLLRRLAHGYQPVRRGNPALGPDRGRLTAVPLGRGPMTSSDFSSACMFIVRFYPS